MVENQEQGQRWADFRIDIHFAIDSDLRAATLSLVVEDCYLPITRCLWEMAGRIVQLQENYGQECRQRLT